MLVPASTEAAYLVERMVDCLADELKTTRPSYG